MGELAIFEDVIAKVIYERERGRSQVSQHWPMWEALGPDAAKPWLETAREVVEELGLREEYHLGYGQPEHMGDCPPRKRSRLVSDWSDWRSIEEDPRT